VLGIPTHLAPQVNAWSLVRAFHGAAIASLVLVAALLVAEHAADPAVHTGPALLALVPMVTMMVVHARFATWRSAAAFLLAGGGCSVWFGAVVERELGHIPDLATSLVSLVTIPLILVGGAGVRPSRVIAWSALGFLVGRCGTLVGTMSVGGDYRIAVLAWVALLLVIGIVGIGARVTSRLRRVQSELLRSAREEHVSAYRQGAELEAAAILHDTVLNHLNAIALAPAGPIDAHLARTVEDDFSMLVGREWLSAHPGRSATAGEPGATERNDAERNDLERIVEECRGAGLSVDVTGDVDTTNRLEPGILTALSRAVAQCLTNVRKHAGTDHAEVSVFEDGRMCTVMVIDDGKGFDERETGADRLGLKNSVRQRIDRVGGEVQIWSSPGSGTSVMMSVPMHAADSGSEGGLVESTP